MPGQALVFSIVDPSNGNKAFQWHRGFAAANDHLFPRDWEQYGVLAANGQIICATGADGNYVGLAYFNFEKDEWEVGGLMVAGTHRGQGVGSTLMRLTLGHVLFEENPLDERQPIIAHVHKENDDPRAIIEHSLKFRHRESIEIDAETLPGLKCDDDGMVHGDVFELATPDSLVTLADWCDAWKGKMKNGQPARIELRDGTSLRMWANAFRDMASNKNA